MPCRNVVSYTAMIDGYAKKGEIEKASELFDVMPRKNLVSWTVLISGYVENEMFDEARNLYKRMAEKNVVVMTAMITGYCKEGKMGDARELFDEIQRKDYVSWNAMITGYGQNSSGEEALKLYLQKLKLGLRPDIWTLGSVLMACSTLASLQDGRQSHVIVIKHGFTSNVSVCNALITMYCRCSAILESELAFKQIESPDLVSWNTIIAAFAQHGLCQKALAYFNEMGLRGFEPDGITFLSALSVCARAGKVNESMNLFDSMVNNYGISMRSDHYACLVDLLGRAGQLEQACKIIQEMPFEADFGIWGSLLSASSVHSNVEIGELAAMKMLDLDPHSSGPYVILSNIYAGKGHKYSWTEIGNKVHNFVGGDMSHSDANNIHLVLKRIRLHMAADDFRDISASSSCC